MGCITILIFTFVPMLAFCFLDLFVGACLNELGIGSWWPYASVLLGAIYWYFVLVYQTTIVESGNPFPSSDDMSQANKKLRRYLLPSTWVSSLKRQSVPLGCAIILIVIFLAFLSFILFFKSSEGKSIFDMWLEFHSQYGK